MRALVNWLDARTGFRNFIRPLFHGTIPCGARWRYVWGTTLVFALAVQFITGMALWLFYSPSAHTAWESVYFIQERLWGGWLLRGIHHHMTTVMTVLLVLHLMQVVIHGAYRAPREINFWVGVVLLLLVMGLARTGYLLPWDQQGYWGTKVATNLVGFVPVIGGNLQRMLVGGPDFGHYTLTRFFAIHAGFLPAVLVVLVVAHAYLVHRQGVAVRQPSTRPDTPYWPDQALRDALACLAVMATVLFLAFCPWIFGTDRALGAPLGPPADPSVSFAVARPEPIFLFLYQFLKLFPRGMEIWGAVILPSLVLALVFLMPLFGRWKLGHWFNIVLSLGLLVGVGVLTYLPIRHDRGDAQHQAGLRHAGLQAKRAKALASAPTGIPPTGAATLLRNDPLTQGPILFARHCAGCHRYDGHDGTGIVPTDPVSAADLKGFASREWLSGLLDSSQIHTPHYFGATKLKDGRMVRFVHKEVARYSEEEKENLRKGLVALSAEAELPAQRELDQRDTAVIEEGRSVLTQAELRCIECHQFRDSNEDATAPDLTGYGSRDWLTAFISNPADRRFYGRRNDRMPAFGEDQILDAQSIGLIVDWLRGDWFKPSESLAGY
jgi:ubiquinol-cytochrome c reductase cytochrome b subunit